MKVYIIIIEDINKDAVVVPFFAKSEAVASAKVLARDSVFYQHGELEIDEDLEDCLYHAKFGDGRRIIRVVEEEVRAN